MQYVNFNYNEINQLINRLYYEMGLFYISCFIMLLYATKGWVCVVINYRSVVIRQVFCEKMIHKVI
jgi:hypothetical protein